MRPPRYCKKCGNNLVYSKRHYEFDAYTGERKYHESLDCPLFEELTRPVAQARFYGPHAQLARSGKEHDHYFLSNDGEWIDADRYL
jgi:hypothetical protein